MKVSIDHDPSYMITRVLSSSESFNCSDLIQLFVTKTVTSFMVGNDSQSEDLCWTNRKICEDWLSKILS